MAAAGSGPSGGRDGYIGRIGRAPIDISAAIVIYGRTIRADGTGTRSTRNRTAVVRNCIPADIIAILGATTLPSRQGAGGNTNTGV